MNSRVSRRVYLRAIVGLLTIVWSAGSAAAADGLRVAFWNVRAGKGVSALAGHAAPFVDTTNCTDPAQPLNAWGAGAMQRELAKAAGDPSVIALGLAESWYSVCASPDNVRKALGWKAATGEQNGVALVARYGFAGPEQWQQLDTTLNTNPADTMWIVRAPVCVDAACSNSLLVYVAHWYGTGTNGATSYERQAQQTVTYLASTAAGQPHVLVGDLNAWEGTTNVCGQKPTNTALPYLRGAGYLDAWRTIHGGAEGFTGMVNRAGCGIPEGYPWKRIDYAWTLPSLQPTNITRFGMVPPGDASPSDHYGIVVTLPNPYPTGTPAPAPEPAPVPPPPPPPSSDGEIVLHARHATSIAGAWSLVADATAAGGFRLANPNAGLPKLATAMAAPISYFELPFVPKAGVAYRLWVRSKAENDAWTNDSVFVQFSGSTAADGSSVFRIGTSSATVYSLEEAAGYGESGWGWQDNGYGINVDGAPVFFDGTPQTIRIQAREDGISIDQIVLSPVKYAGVAPGQAKQDTTILEQSTGIATAPVPEAPAPAPPVPAASMWSALVHTAAEGATMIKTSGCPDCGDAGGVGPRVSSGGSFNFSVNGGQRLVVGLGTDTSSNTSYQAVLYGFSFSDSGTYEIREAGVYKGDGRFAPADLFAISLENGTVKYFHGGALVYTSRTAAPADLVVDTTLVTIGASVTLR